MNSQEAQELLKKYEKGLCNPQEVKLVETWFDVLINKGEWAWTGLDKDVYSQIIFNKIESRITKVNKKPILLWHKLATAIILLLTIGAGLWFYNHKNNKDDKSIHYVNDILSGKYGATLTLGNGEKIILSNATNGKLVEESGSKIEKASDGSLVYSKKTLGIPEENTVFNTLSTSRGQTYMVQLPDSTKVWLNASSSLKYPASFNFMKQRFVELIGEAYFQVSKDRKHPFVVKSGLQELVVLGTNFNVSAYGDEPRIITTLVEGSIKINAGGSERILKPNQESILTSGSFQISDVDAEYAIAWKNGFFIFNGESLESIMNKIERWYNVQVEYHFKPNTKLVFQGKISRSRNLSEVLKVMEYTGLVHFKVEGRRIMVTN